METLEGRLLLSVTAVDDIGIYSVDEDQTLSTALAIATSGPNGTTWKYLDNGVDQGTAWRSAAFNDSTWAEGEGNFGYPAPRNTIMSFGPDTAAKYPTYYFRYVFNTADYGITTQAQLDAIVGYQIVTDYDDGFVMYLNDEPIDSINVAPNSPFGTFASANAQATKTTRGLGNPGLQLGVNVLAVEVKQENAGSSDILFDTDFYISYSPTGTILANDDLSGLNGTLRVAAESQPVDSVNGTPAGTVQVDPDTGDFLFTPQPNYFGTAVFTYSITDADNSPSVGVVEIVVNSINDLPANPTNDAYTTQEGESIIAGDVVMPPLVNLRDSWRYFDNFTRGSAYPTDGTGTRWNENGFNTASSTLGPWATGNAPFAQGAINYFNNNALPTTTLGGAAGTHTTYLFRKEVNLANGTSIDFVDITLLADDGAIIYINGEEVARLNMGNALDPVDSSTFAGGAAATAGNEDALSTIFAVPVTGIFVDGVNTIAVEVHQNAIGSSDAGFALEMRVAEVRPLLSPLRATWDVLDNLPRGSAYPTDGTNPWNHPDFDVLLSTSAPWRTGLAAPFAQGTIDYVTNNPPLGATLGGAAGTHTTYLFRRTFNIADGADIASLDLNLLADDGAVVYLNGVEIARLNMAAGPVTPDTFTLNAAAGNEATLTAINDVNVLGIMRNGNNVLAVEVHQNSTGSSDLGFEMSVRGRYGSQLSVMANDNVFDVEDGTNLIAVLVDSSEVDAVGTLDFNPDGTFTFTPNNGDVSGSFRFTYVLQDQDGGQSLVPATVTLTLTPADDGPIVAADDIGVPQFVVAENSSLVINAGNTPAPVVNAAGIGLLANDTTHPGDVNDPVTITIVNNANLNGTLTLERHPVTGFHTGGFTYTPAANFNGTASFTYRVNDGFTNSNTVSVEITVTPVNSAPTAVADFYTVSEGASIIATLAGPDAGALIPAGSVWKYLDDNTSQDSFFDPEDPAWFGSPLYDDSTWASGPAQLGFGEGDEATVVDNNVQITTYFRRLFDVPGSAGVTELNLMTLFDDGIVVYINGAEVYRNNLPAFPIHTTPATGTLADDGKEWRRVTIDLAALGVTLSDTNNLIAVGVHQVNTTSSDLTFDLQLTLNPSPFFGVLSNDSDIDSPHGDLTATPLNIAAVDAVGTLTLNPDGTFTFVPDNPELSGTFTFTYTLSDNDATNPMTAVGTVTLTLTPEDDGPIFANDDFFIMDEDTTLVINAANTPPLGPDSAGVGLLANDITHPADAGNPVTITIVNQTDPLAIITTGNDGSFTYTPGPGFAGFAFFEYFVNDGFTNSNVASVAIQVNSVNDPPVAGNDAYSVNEDGVLSVAFPRTADLPPITTYLPLRSPWDYLDTLNIGEAYPLDESGNAWFENDFDPGTSDPGIGTWLFNVAPFAQGAINAFTAPITALAGASANTTTYLFRTTFDVPNGTSVTQLNFSLLADDGAVVYLNGVEVMRQNMPGGTVTPTTFATGAGNEDAFTNTLVNVTGRLNNGTNYIAVELHQADLTSSDAGFGLQISSVLEFAGVLNNDTDEENDPITAELVPGHGPTNGTLVFNPNGTFTYTPFPNFSGTDSFEYRAFDGSVYSAPATVTLTVNALPDNVVANSDTYSTAVNTTLNVTLPNLHVAQGTHAQTLVSAGSNWHYIDNGSDQFALNPNWRNAGFNPAAAGWSGPAPAEFGYGDGDEATVLAQNDGMGGPRHITFFFATTFNLPDASGIDSLIVHLKRDDGAAVYLNGVEIVRDNLLPVDDINQFAGQLTEFIRTENQFRAFRINLNSLPGGNPLVSGTNYVAAEVHQQSLTSSDLTFDLEIAVDDRKVLGVLANDFDPDGAAMNATIVSGPFEQGTMNPSGSLTLNADGTFSYTPATDFEGFVTFTYRVSDGASTADATVTIAVGEGGSVNFPPTPSNDPGYTTFKNTQLVVNNPAQGVLANDLDDGLVIALEARNGQLTNPSQGTLVLNTNGTFTFTPAMGVTGPVTFTYDAHDGQFSVQATATITVRVRGDFNNDFMLTPADVELLHTQIRTNTGNLAFDLNGDSALNVNDLYFMLESPTLFNTRRADLNLDGRVDITDLARIATFFGLAGVTSYNQGDTNADGLINITDLAAVATFFGFTGGGPGGGDSVDLLDEAAGGGTSAKVVVAPSASNNSGGGASSWNHISSVLDGDDDDVQLV